MMRGCVAKRWSAAALLAKAALLVALTGSAQTPKLGLEWSAPAGCPGDADVRASAERLLGGPIEPRLTHSLVMQGRVAAEGDRLVLHLETIDDGIRGQRTLSGATCEELTSAAALILALAVDPKAVAEHSARADEAAPGAGGETAPGTSPNPAEPPPTVAVPEPVVPPPTRASDSSQSSPLTVTLRGEAALAGELGALPGPSFGPELAVRLGLDRFRVRPSVTYFVPQFASANDPARSAAGGDVSLLVGALAGCYALTTGSAALDACAAVEGGALFADGGGFDVPRSASPFWVAAGGGLDFAVQIAGPFAVRFAVGAMAPFGRSRVRFRENTGDLREIHRPSVVSGRAALGIAAAFW